MDESARDRRALALVAVCTLLSLGGLGAGLVAGAERALDAHLLEDTAAALAWSALAATWAMRGRRSATVLAIAGAWSLASAANGWAVTGAPGALFGGWVGTWTWAVALGSSFTLGLLEWDGHDARRRLRRAALAALTGMAVGFATLPAIAIESVEFRNPVGLAPAPVLTVAAAAVTAGIAFTSIAALALGLTSPARRRRGVPVVACAIVGIAGMTIGGLANDWASIVQILTVPLLPLAMALTPTHSASRVLRGLGGQLDVAADPARALPAALAEIAGDLGLSGLAIETDGRSVACVGDPGTRRMPMTHLGRREGDLLVPATMDARDEADLLVLIPPLAAVLASLRLVAELRRSRQELAAARADERRRVRHDLHDEVGPLLAAAVVQTDVAELALEDAPGRARSALAKARAANAQAVDTLRRIARDLTPAADDDVALGRALEELADRLSGYAEVTVSLAGSPPLPPATQAAVYRIAAEAAGNAVRHASPSTVRIRLVLADEEMELSITDDGTGFDATVPTTGVGVRSMRERAAALHGRLDIVSGPGGTQVLARIPVAR